MSAPPSQFGEESPERRILARAIRRLPSRYRDVFVLHRFTGMPLEQIAERLGIETKAVEAHLAEALLRLSRAADKAGGRGSSKGS